jgi:hypothetical protein
LTSVAIVLALQRGPRSLEIDKRDSDILGMADLILALLQALLEGLFTVSGRWVLSLGGWTSNVFAETLLGFLVWMLAIVLFVALFASLV